MEKKYYHNGVAFEVGQTIVSFAGVFGPVEVKLTKPAEYETFYLAEDDPACEEVRVQAFCDGLDATGQSVQEAVQALYRKLAATHAHKDNAGQHDHSKVNGMYAELQVRDHVYLTVSTKEEPALAARQTADGKYITTTIPPAINLARCQELCAQIDAALGQQVTHLRMWHRKEAGEKAEFEAGAEYGWEGWFDIQILVDRVYYYNRAGNSLLVKDDDEWVYANDDGVETYDGAAIADSLGSMTSIPY